MEMNIQFLFKAEKNERNRAVAFSKDMFNISVTHITEAHNL